jgi:hypothetical protein
MLAHCICVRDVSEQLVAPLLEAGWGLEDAMPFVDCLQASEKGAQTLLPCSADANAFCKAAMLTF